MITRRFLGSGTHLLPALADELVAPHDDAVDLGRQLVVLPTSRSRRQLDRLLLDRVQPPAILIPPEILTPARLLERLVVPKKTLASPMAMAAAWMQAVQSLTPDQCKALVGHDETPSANEVDAIADRLGLLTRTLAAHDLLPHEIPARCEAMSMPVNQDIWDAIDAARCAMLKWIDDHGMEDRDDRYHEALDQKDLNLTDIDAVMVVGADLPGREVRCLHLLAKMGLDVSIIIHDTGDDRTLAWSDAGVVEPSAWTDRPIEIKDECITVSATDDDQSAAALDVLASLGRIKSSQVRIVAPDASIRQAFLAAAEGEGVAVDCWEGETSSSTRIGHLVQLLMSASVSATASALGELIRHPDIDAWLQRCGIAHPVSVWDEIWMRHAPHDLSALLKVVHRDHHIALLEALDGLMRRLDGARSLSMWASPLMELILEVLEGADLDELASEVIDQVHALLTEMHELPPDETPWTAEEALRLLGRGLASKTATTTESTGGVEVIGWLDAHLDTAPHIVILGMREGVIPSTPGVDPWLPEMHRAALGLDSRARRLGRDSYLLAAIMESGRDVHLITARTHNDGEPCAPSGLLLRTQGDDLAKRIMRFVGEEDGDSAPSMALRRGIRREESSFDPWPMPEGSPVITSMAVTSFRNFFSDPYLFMLGRDERIRATKINPAHELDAMQFGTLVHGVLERWGKAELKSGSVTSDAAVIEQDLHAALDGFVHTRFGDHPMPMVRLQVEMVRRRLSTFAQRQAERAAEGWRIHAIELSFGDNKWDDHPSVMFPDPDGLPLRGKIDRIDVHDTLGYQALDYKTGAKVEDAKSAHWTARQGWIDVQLPLYRVLLRSIDVQVPPTGLGYIRLPATEADCDFNIADWSESDLVEAESEAAEIVRIIKCGELADLVEESMS